MDNRWQIYQSETLCLLLADYLRALNGAWDIPDKTRELLARACIMAEIHLEARRGSDGA